MLDLSRLPATLDSALPAVAWGELNPVPWVRICTAMEPDDRMCNINACVMVFVDDHALTVGGQTFWIKPPKRQYVGQFALSHNILASLHTPEQLALHLAQHLEHTIRSLSLFLYAYDPRIGQEWGKDVPGMDKCPLFDPPGLRFPSYEVGMDIPCPICGKNMTQWEPAMWAGGTIHWVHQECWLRIAGAPEAFVPSNEPHAPMVVPSLRSFGHPPATRNLLRSH